MLVTTKLLTYLTGSTCYKEGGDANTSPLQDLIIKWGYMSKMKNHFHDEICENARIENEVIDYQPYNEKCKCGGDWEQLFIFSRVGQEPVATGDYQCSDCEEIREGA